MDICPSFPADFLMFEGSGLDRDLEAGVEMEEEAPKIGNHIGQKGPKTGHKDFLALTTTCLEPRPNHDCFSQRNPLCFRLHFLAASTCPKAQNPETEWCHRL